MKKTTGFICLILCLVMMLNLCACGKAPEPAAPSEIEPQPKEEQETASDTETVVIPYMASAIEKPDGMKRVKSMAISGNTMYLIGSTKDADSVFSTELGSGKWQQLNISINEQEEPAAEGEESEMMPDSPMEIAGFDADGENLYIVGQNWGEEGPEYLLCIYDLQSSELKAEQKFEGLEEQFINRWFKTGDYFIALGYGKAFVFSFEGGEPQYTIEENVLFAAEVKGEVYAARSGDGENDLCRLNIESGELQKLCSFPVRENARYASYKSQGETFTPDEEILTKIDPESGDAEELFNWRDTGMGIGDVPECMHVMENGDIYLIDSWANIIYKVSPYNGAPKKVLTIAYAGTSGVYENSAMAKFNSENEEYIIHRMDCDWENPEKLLTQISAGDGPDILYMGNSTDREMDNPFLRVKVDDALCVDLMPYLEADPDIKKEDFVPGLLDSICTDGKLYKMPADFNIVSIVAPKELADKVEKWDMDALWEVYENLPEGYTLFGMGQEETLRLFCMFCSVHFVDMENGSCSFDDPDFARWLELLKEIEYFDYENTEGNVLDMSSIHPSMADYCRERFGDYEYMGIPTSDGGVSFFIGSMGGYSIMANSQNKDAAWDYIKVMLSYEIQDALAVFGMQVIEKNLMEKLENAAQYSNFTPEDEEKFMALLDNSEGMASGGILSDIITEEAQKYFADQKSLEETVKMIQSRAGIYLAEQK